MAPETNISGEVEATEHPRTCLKNRLWDKWLDFIIALIIWGTVGFLMVKVIPAFTQVYAHIGGKLPTLARLIIQFDKYVGSTMSLLMIAGLVLFQTTRTRVAPKPSVANSVRSWDNKVMLVAILIGAILFFVVTVGLVMPVIPGAEMVNGR